MLAITVVLAALLQAWQVAKAPPAAGDPVPGGGRFVSLAQTKLADTRDGVGGVPIGQVDSGEWIEFQVAGRAGVPTSNVSAVMVSLSAVNPVDLGYVRAFPLGSPVPNVTHLSYDANEMQSNTAIVQLGPDGGLGLWNSGGPTDLLAVVTGFFTEPTDAPGDAGGYVAVTPDRIFDTRDPEGPHPAPVANETVTMDVAGVAGVATNADAVVATISVIDPLSAGYAIAHASGAARPDTGNLIWDDTGNSITTTVTVPIGADGKIAIYTRVDAAHLAVDVHGYFSSNASEGAGFSFVEARLADTRPSSTPLAADATMTVPVAGTNGLPATGVAGAVVNVTGTQPTAEGSLIVWRTGAEEPTTPGVQFTAGAQRTNLMIVPPGEDGTISIRNTSTAPVHVVVDLHGWFATPPPRLGLTDAMTTIDQAITDHTNLSVNVATGNALVSTTDYDIAGTGLNSAVAHHYNSRSEQAGSLPAGWNLSAGQDVALEVAFDQSVLYQTPDGGLEVFAPAPGGGYTSPPGVNATLANGAVSGTWDLTFHDSRTVYHYDALGGTGNVYLTSITDNNGNQITYTYDAAHQLTTITDTQGRTITVAYTTDGFIDTLTDTAGSRTVDFDYTDGQLTTVTDAAGDTLTYSYTGTELTSITDPDGRVTELAYDTVIAPHMATEITHGLGTPDAGTTTLAYSEAGITEVTDANDATTSYSYDTLGRVVQVIDPLGRSRSLTWTSNNAIATFSVDALSATYSASYDSLNNLTGIQTPDTGTGGGHSWQLGYPAPAGSLADYDPTSQTDPQGNTTTYGYDGNGNITTATPPTGSGGPITNGYQGNTGVDCGAQPGQLCSSADGNGNATTYGYDAVGNVTTVTPPAPLGDTSIVSDAVSRTDTVVDGNDVEIDYTYDELDRPTQVTYNSETCDPAAGTCITYAYDGAGNLIERVDNTGTTTWSYDAQNRPTSKTLPGNVVSEITYDAVGNVLTYTDPAGTITYTYDAANNLTTLAEPGGSCPTGATTPNSTQCTLFSYDDAGQRAGIAYPNGVTITTDYDIHGRVATTEAVGPSGTLAGASYNYADPNTSADTAIRHAVAINGVTTTYEYNGLNQLTKATTGSTIETWTYDAGGNRLTYSKTGEPTVYYTYNAANQLCHTATTEGGTCASPPAGADTYTYDGNGNLLTGGGNTLTYNDKNQTATATDGTTTQTFTYAGADSTELLDDGTTSYLNGLLGITQHTTDTSETAATRTPDGTLMGLRDGDSSSYDSLYYALDALTSVLALTDENAAVAASYTYNAYGITTATGPAAASNPYTYASGLTQPTGLIKFGTRYYDPNLGRWTQQDPVPASLTNPAKTNLYAYVANSPTNYLDPTGRDFWDYLYGAVDTAASGLLAGGISGCVAGWLWGPVGCATGALVAGVSAAVYNVVSYTYDYFW